MIWLQGPVLRRRVHRSSRRLACIRPRGHRRQAPPGRQQRRRKGQPLPMQPPELPSPDCTDRNRSDSHRASRGTHGLATVGQIAEDVSGQPLHRYLALTCRHRGRSSSGGAGNRSPVSLSDRWPRLVGHQEEVIRGGRMLNQRSSAGPTEIQALRPRDDGTFGCVTEAPTAQSWR